MDYFETIKRAARMVWRHKSLWVLGFIAGLSGGGGGSGGNFGGSNFGAPGSGSGTGGSSGNPFNSPELQEALRWITENSALLIALVLGVCLCLVLLSLLFLVLGEIGQGGLISNAARIGAGEAPGFGDGWRAGVSRARPLVGQRLLLSIPGLILGLIILAILAVAFVPLFSELISGGGESAVIERAMGALFGSLCVIVPLGCIAWLYQILVAILSTFGRRAVMLDGAGAIAGLRAGWSVFRGNILHTIVFAVIVVALQLIIGIGLTIAGFAALVPGIVAMIASGGNEPSVAGVALLAVGGLVLFAVVVLSSSVLTAFSSATWTLAYQQFKSRLAGTLPPASAMPTDALQA